MTPSDIYLGIITQNQKQNIEELTSVASFFDGIFATDHNSTDGTFEILNERKGKGAIVQMPFLNRHDHSMNSFLFHPKFRNGSWCFLRDSCERINENFAKNIKGFILELEKNNIGGVYQYSKLLLFKKTPYVYFANSPHWGAYNVLPNYLAIEKLPGFEDPKNYAYSIRNDIRPKHHFIDHFVKYYYEYSSFSNHLLLGRENNHQEFQAQEQVRLKFIDYCIDELKIDQTVEALLNYLKTHKLNYELRWFLNYSDILNDFYCFHILNHSIEEITTRKEKKELFKIN